MTITEKSIQKKIEKATSDLAAIGPILKGSLSKMNKSGKDAFQLTWKAEGNKTRILYVSGESQKEVREMIGSYKKGKLLLEKLAELQVELFKIKGKSAK